MHSKSHVTMLAMKVVYVFVYTFFKNSSDGNAWFLSLTLFIGSAIVFFTFLYQRPYYDAYT